MEEDNTGVHSAHAHVVGVKSWLAYAGTFVLAGMLFFVALPLAFQYGNDLAAAGVLVVSALIVGYRILLLRSVQLYYDDIGVWAYSGILPWKKGITGVKWRDMDEATFEPGFWSWITRSYTVCIRHRYTKANEIVLTNIANGKRAVGELSARQQDMIRAGTVE